MKRVARAIVLHNQNILLMKRNKFGQEYYCLVGGGIELGETADQAVLREMREETSLQVANPRLVFVEEAGEPYGTQYIFVCDYTDGEVKLSPDSIEAQINQGGKNLYQPLWLPISKFAGVPFRSTTLQKVIIDALQTGFPAEPQLFRSGAKISNQQSSSQRSN